MTKVYFIGAGPGDPELITLKGKKRIQEADVIIYAGSLVNPQVIADRKENAQVYNSASMTLPEVIEVMKGAAADDKIVARVHTGDPSIYGAIREQMDALEELAIDYEVVPGVSSFVASAAQLKKEFTLPEVSQTVILTRMEGRTPVPSGESLASLAQHQASMAIFLSVQMIQEVVEELLTAYPSNTPVAVVQKATWEDEKIVEGTLADIALKVKEADIKKTAQILVGNFLGNDYALSKLYDENFTHEYRRGKE
ncbi:cobalt-precorrin 4 C11-methyltransferase [Anaerovirgula multivorans]|uniref:Cobalt-precorrin 4 C11-methyltransferase n=1 Tax=Anaerovirgula multivorans TaxID=312168 RepID=A0A239EPQ0_9FIRM|nr:precorrin-4 C(11)-methyltransferase [Anaerovirgula multivorans]SNS45902.1 cobalt-precorrin 4 C11-methyltransferase [Anaerovirgula multivorans]